MKFPGLILLLLIAMAIGTSTAARASWPDHFTVKVVNQLQNHSDLKIHCKSKDTQLGDHVLRLNQDFHFNFKVNFSGSTLFWCTLTQGPHSKTFDVFDAAEEFVSSCCDNKVCSWFARNDGIYAHSSKYGDELRYNWD